MFISILKNTIIFLTSFYLCDKVNNSFCKSIRIYFNCFFCALILSVCFCFLKEHIPYLSIFLSAFLFTIIYAFKQKNMSRSVFCISLTSYVINLLAFAITSFLFCVFAVLLLGNNHFANTKYLTLAICMLYPGIVLFVLRNKHIYQGMSSIFFNGMINYNTFSCIVALTTLTLEQTATTNYKLEYLKVSIIIFCLIIILYWWRSQITKTYREKLRLLELKTLRTAKAENEAYITKLEAENKRLGTIIHKDNRIVNAMADSVCDYLSASANSNTTDLQAKGQSLSDEINSIKTYRQELLCQGSQSGSSIPQTNQAGVDAIISFMVKEAASYGITMKFHFDGEFFTAKHFTATEMDFVHLLSDLLENAIIATRHANGKALGLSLQILKGTPAISVSDSGIPFEIETFMKLGTCEASTHTDEGGTGIGLMDIWTFKKKYHASLVIEELDNSTYSKRLSILFDNRNKYLIISNRFQQIISNQTRSDLLVINSSTNELTELIDK